MNKNRLNQILSVLLLPYREKEFLTPQKDVIAEVRYAFARLKYQGTLNTGNRKKWRRFYEEAEINVEKFLKKHTEWQVHTLDDFRLLLNLFYPEEEISKQFRPGIERICLMENQDPAIWDRTSVIDRIYLNNLYKISKSLLTFRDGKIAIRTWMNDQGEEELFDYPNVFDKVEIWNLLSRMVSADLLIAAFFVEANLKEVFYLYNQTGGILLSDKTLDKLLQQGIAETHMHLSAGGEFVYYWEARMEPAVWEQNLASQEKYRRFCGEDDPGFPVMMYRILWAEYLEYLEECEEIQPLSFSAFIGKSYPDESEILGEMFYHLQIGDTLFYSEEWKRRYHSIILHWQIKYEVKDSRSDFLLETAYRKYRKYHTYSEMIFLFKGLKYFRENPKDHGCLHLFLQYLRIKNRYYMQMTQYSQMEGLANFRHSFRKMTQEAFRIMSHERRYDVIFKSIAHNTYLRKLEVRITPGIKIYENYYKYENGRDEIRRGLLKDIRGVLAAYRRNMLETAGINDAEPSEEVLQKRMDIPYQNGKLALPTLGIVFHYLKTDFVDNRIGDTCWLKEWDEIKDDSKHLLVWREALVKNAEILEKLRSEVPLLGEYVVGIDAASEEHKTEPWVFAPVYSAIRNRKITKPVLQDDGGRVYKINNIGFTYHVGEEYRHLLSGLRHVDEVITHFHYKAGDRLGHATALGTDVKYWIGRNEVVVIPILEHLENLLWLWGNMVHKNWGIEINAEALEGRILELAKKIYGGIQGLTVHMLYEAYQWKFLRNYEEHLKKMRKYKTDDPERENCEDGGWNHFCKFYRTDHPYGIMWTVEKVFCTYFCPLFYQRFNRPILVHVDDEEYGMLKKVQDYMIRQIELLGIYVETNPTSNLDIGEIEALHSHPILNLNSKNLVMDAENEHEVLVTVNSDNPTIFNTSSENELAYIYHALSYRGYKKESIMNWIDQVRKMGIDSSFVKNEKKPSLQFAEITQLLNTINEILKEV